MIFNLTKGISNCDFESVSDNGTTLFFLGLPIILGCDIGKSSAKQILNNYINKKINYSEIYGFYLICIHNSLDNSYLFFSDNSGMYKYYFNEENISSSVFDYVDQVKHTHTLKLNPTSVVEFLTLGHVSMNRTLINDLISLDFDKVILVKSNCISFIKKEIPSIYSTPDYSFSEFMSKLIRSLDSKNIAVDLTGGVDSRLIFSLANCHGDVQEVGLTGYDGQMDVDIAKKIAKHSKKEIFVFRHESKRIDKDYFLELFEYTDGLVDMIVFHRLKPYYEARSSRGINFQLSGAGGELFKDFWWLQDFPFYNKKKPNYNKLYNTRIQSTSFSSTFFTNEYQVLYNKQKNDTIKYFSDNYVSYSNTRTYDKIYYSYKMANVAGPLIKSANSILHLYSPFLEYDSFRIGFNLNRNVRIFNIFHRRLLSVLDKGIASFKTTEGMTLSLNILSIVSDFFRFFKDKFFRVFRLIVRKLFNRTIMIESPSNPELFIQLKDSIFFKEYIQTLQKAEVISKDIEIEKIPNSYLGRLITVALMYEKINVK